MCECVWLADGVWLCGCVVGCLYVPPQLCTVLESTGSFEADTLSPATAAMWTGITSQLVCVGKWGEGGGRIPSPSPRIQHLALGALVRAALIRNDATDVMRAVHVLLSRPTDAPPFDVRGRCGAWGVPPCDLLAVSSSVLGCCMLPCAPVC